MWSRWTVIGLLLLASTSACGAPATQAGFRDAFCAVDADLKQALSDLPTADLRSGAAFPALKTLLAHARSSWSELPDWPDGREAKAGLLEATDGLLAQVAAAADAGGVADIESWTVAYEAFTNAQRDVHRIAGQCEGP